MGYFRRAMIADSAISTDAPAARVQAVLYLLDRRVLQLAHNPVSAFSSTSHLINGFGNG
jgi:hypothetical protein